jgi:ferredoxin-nitrate reductase
MPKALSSTARLVFGRTVAESAAICGVSEAISAWQQNTSAKPKVLLPCGRWGLTKVLIGVNKNLSLINLNLITGHIGKPGSGPLSLTGQPNAMGGREVGGLANLLPAHRNLSNPAAPRRSTEVLGRYDIQSQTRINRYRNV